MEQPEGEATQFLAEQVIAESLLERRSDLVCVDLEELVESDTESVDIGEVAVEGMDELGQILWMQWNRKLVYLAKFPMKIYQFGTCNFMCLMVLHHIKKINCMIIILTLNLSKNSLSLLCSLTLNSCEKCVLESFHSSS